MKTTVLSLCDRTGNMVQPWLDAGYHAVTVDLQKQDKHHDNRRHVLMDVRGIGSDLMREWRPAIVFAFPPCTHLAVSGARWFKEKGLGSLIGALQLVDACRRICESSSSPYMIENPVGTLSTYWREPDFAFDPCDYGDPYTKRTCLWIGNGFVMPEIVRPDDMFAGPTWVPPSLGSMIHRMPPSEDRGDKRSTTPMGFAHAVFRANVAHTQPIHADADASAFHKPLKTLQE